MRRNPAPRGRNWERTAAHGLHELSWLGAPFGCGTDGSTDFMGYDMVCGFFLLVGERQEWCWRFSGFSLTQQHLEQPLVQAEHECRRHSSVYGGFLEVFGPSTVAACSVRTWKRGAVFPPGFVLCSPVSGVWVLLLEYRELDSSGDAVVTFAVLGSTVDTCFYVEVDLN